MATAEVGNRGRGVPVLGVLWSPRTWAATAQLVTGAVIGLLGFVVLLTSLIATIALAPTLIGGAVLLAVSLLIAHGLTVLQIGRVEAFSGTQVTPPSPVTRPVRRWVVAELRAIRAWRHIGFHLLAGLLLLAMMTVVIGTWAAGLALTPAILYGPEIGGATYPVSAALTVCGVALLLAAPWVANAAAAADATVTRWMLGTARTDELEHQVAALSASRDDAVGAADAERRRIERDLHDGVQQRLTSLAMNLGIARTALRDAPEPARDAVARAHDEAKLALTELRDLVRGMHPAVLHDRGLDAALSGVVARSPVPVRLRVEMSTRASPDVEAVAYFVVSEALTNATRHAHATQLDVRVTRCADRLHIAVTDDGRGGADPLAGTGLSGLGKRVRSVDGTLHIDSPVGGPTTIEVDLPCAS